MALGESTADKYIILCAEYMWKKGHTKNVCVPSRVFIFSLVGFKTPSNRFMPSSKAIFMHVCVLGIKSTFNVHNAQAKFLCYFAFFSFFRSIPFLVRFFPSLFEFFSVAFVSHEKIMNHHQTPVHVHFVGG